MSTKEGNDYPIRPQISIQVSSSNDPNNNNNERQFTTKDGGCTDRQKKKQPTNNPSSMYVKFDKKKRDEVLCWCHSALFLLALGTCLVSFTVPLLRKSRPRGIAMWQWSLLVTVLLGGPLLSKAIVRFVLFFLDREFSAKENIIYYVAGLIESAWVVLWFSMILVAWLIVVDEPDYLGVSRDENEKIVKKFTTTYPIINVTLVNFILGSFLWLLKELALMTAKSSFHIRRFFDRIREALMHQCIIESLSCIDGNKTLAEKKDVVMSVGKKKVFQKRRFGRKNKIFFDVTCLDEVTQEDVSCWGMKIVIDWIMVNQYLAYYDKTNNNRFKEIDCEYEAIHAADLIFSSLVRARDPNPIIGSEELKKHFPEEKVYEVKKCLLKGADSNQIEKEVFKKWMVKVYRYRSALVRALQANKTLFKAFNRFINVLLVFFIFALWLIMLRVETRKVIYVIATAIVGSAFVFGEPCRKMFENLLFVFLVHPFDIGDCCLIDNTPVIIEEIGVLTTTALTFDNEIKHYPNSNLIGQTISNYTRSPHMGDSIEFSLNINTPNEKIEVLKDYINSYIHDNSQYWYPEHHYWVVELQESMSTMKMRLHFVHTINYHDFREREARKSKLVLEITKILKKLMLITNKKE